MNQKSLTKITNKYQCIVSGEKRMSPCSGCTEPKACVSRGMQYKENEIMEEKAVVKVDADGKALGCAKGLDGDCGYKTGARICGACGAVAVAEKSDDEEYLDYKTTDDEFEADVAEVGDEEEDFEVDGEKAAPQSTTLDDRIAELEEELESLREERAEMMGGSDDESEGKMGSMHDMRKRGRSIRAKSLNIAIDDTDEEVFSCAIDKKVYAATESICDNCPGGCKSADGGPNLLEIEGIAEDMFGGKVLDSGYGRVIDSFVVDVERKDGKVVEAFFDGASGECIGWQMLYDSPLSQKSAEQDDEDVVDFDQATEIALAKIEGKALSVEPDIFEGAEAYAVEIDGVDGKSYDVYVSLDGEVLGYDEYTPEEAMEIEAEVAEIALKRAYSEDDRMKMAENGEALPDGSYPIANEEDLDNAIRAFGRAKDKDKAKAHIMKRAADLGMEEAIPESWTEKSAEEDEDFDEVDAEDAEVALKQAYNDDDLEKMAKDGLALPDGSFPIKDGNDLRNAIRAYGRAADKKLAKAHIMKRALDLKMEDLIPNSWVPKKIQEEFSDGKKDASDEFLASLMEFEILSVEQEARGIANDSL